MISAKLVGALLVSISGYTGYAIPGEPPRIVALPHEVLEQRVCGRPCQVMGFTSPDGTIAIDDALLIGGDPLGTSILVHELTHFLQMRSVAHPLATDCEAWHEREREAFEVQARWLRDNTASPGQLSVVMARAGWSGPRMRCMGAVPRGNLPLIGQAAPFGRNLDQRIRTAAAIALARRMGRP